MSRKDSRLTKDKIDPAKILESVSDAGAGAIVMFLGTVRNTSEAGRIQSIEYEPYERMAAKSLEQAEKEVKRRWPETRSVKIIHRVGRLSIGEVSVAVAVSSPHRGEAFEACRHAIERIKHEVPIWKREKLASGREVWVEGVPMGSGQSGVVARSKRIVRRTPRSRRL